VNLVPIPTTPEYIHATYHLWSPFLPDIAKRSIWSIEDLLTKLCKIEVQPVLVVDEATPVALLGISFVKDGEELVGELVWLTGRQRHEWQHLVAELERYLRDMRCVKCRPICRRGWQKFLEAHGYERIGSNDDRHVIMEKVL